MIRKSVIWVWLILSDLAKYLMTRSIARSLCDSWASCSWRAISGEHSHTIAWKQKFRGKEHLQSGRQPKTDISRLALNNHILPSGGSKIFKGGWSSRGWSVRGMSPSPHGVGFGRGFGPSPENLGSLKMLQFGALSHTFEQTISTTYSF